MNLIALQNLVERTFVSYVEYHPQIDSTNNRARRIALGEEPLRGHENPTAESLRKALPCLIVADRQLAGRGRGTNRWWTGPGSLAMTLLLPPLEHWQELFNAPPGAVMPSAKAHPGLIGLAAALAVVQTVRPRLPQIPLGLHWPNDVFAGGKKLAGILVEILASGLVVVGIGGNLNNTAQQAPPELQHRVTTLRDLTGQTHSVEDFLLDLLGHLEKLFQTFLEHPEKVAQDAHHACLQKGHPLKVLIPVGAPTCQGNLPPHIDEKPPREQENQGGQYPSSDGFLLLEGLCEGIGPQGELLLQIPKGLRRVFSGSIV